MKTSLFNLQFGSFALLSVFYSGCTAKTAEPSMSDMPVVATTIQVGSYPVLSCSAEQLKDTVRIPLSELADELHIVPLDGSDVAQVKAGSFSLLSEKYILVYNKTYSHIPAKVFTKEGKYLTDIAPIQTQTKWVKKGTNELIKTDTPVNAPVYHYQIDDKTDRVYFIDCNSSIILSQEIAENGTHHGFHKLAENIRFPKAVFRVQDNLLHVMGLSFDAKNPATQYTAFTQEVNNPQRIIHAVSAQNYVRSQGKYSNEIYLNENTEELSMAFISSLLPESQEADTLYYYRPGASQLIPKFVMTPPKGCTVYYNELPAYYYGNISTIKQIATGSYQGERGEDFLIEKASGRGGIAILVNDYLDGSVDPMGIFCFRNGYYQHLIEPKELKELLTRCLKNGKLSSEKEKEYTKLRDSIGTNDNSYLIYARLK